MTDLGKFPDAMVPTWTTGNDSQGMGPVEFLRGSKWKSWDGRLAASLMATQKLEVLAFSADGSVKSTTRAPIPAARMRSVVLGPDANLYIATDSGAIWKIVPR
jgi:glucose/arabinose dehydrogenase